MKIHLRNVKALGREILLGIVWRLFIVLDALGVSRLVSWRILSAVKIDVLGFPRGGDWFPEETEVRSPHASGENTDKLGSYPAIGFSKIRDGLVCANRRVSSVISGDHFCVPRAASEGPWNIKIGNPTTGGVMRQSGNRLLVRVKPTGQKIPRAIFPGSWTPLNWYHWLIDTLPAVYLTRFLKEDYEGWPLVISEDALGRKAWLEPLSFLLDGRSVLPLVSDGYHEISELVWMDSPTSPGPIPLYASKVPRFSMHGTVMKEYRDFLVTRTVASGSSAYASGRSRVFLARKEGSERPYNQEELLEVASGFGYAPTFLEDLSFADSVSVMASADSVVGPHGAGWANAIFCRPGTSALMWTWDSEGKDNWFQNVGSIAGLSMRSILVDGPASNPYDLSPSELRRQLVDIERELA